MKRNSLISLLLFSVLVATAQDQSDYLKRGDEAMKNLDYSLAKILFEEVVSANCNQYSIRQLTTIWQKDVSMHPDMNNVMRRCFSCLENDARLYNDTVSINLLITYYKEGIGTAKNEAMAESWQQRLQEIRTPSILYGGTNRTKPPREKIKWDFFAGYSASWVAPVGLTAGAIGGNIGGYLRLRSNLSFQNYTEVCDQNFSIEGGLNNSYHRYLDIKKVNTFIGTGGLIFKVAPEFYISAGAGYCSREVIYKFEKIGAVVANPEGEFWAKYKGETSFSGLALDLDGTFRFEKNYGASIGFSLLNFKYLSANAGFVVFF